MAPAGADIDDVVRTRLHQGFTSDDLRRRLPLEFGWPQIDVDAALEAQEAGEREGMRRRLRLAVLIGGGPVVVGAVLTACLGASHAIGIVLAFAVPVFVAAALVVFLSLLRDR